MKTLRRGTRTFPPAAPDLNIVVAARANPPSENARWSINCSAAPGFFDVHSRGNVKIGGSRGVCGNLFEAATHEPKVEQKLFHVPLGRADFSEPC